MDFKTALRVIRRNMSAGDRHKLMVAILADELRVECVGDLGPAAIADEFTEIDLQEIVEEHLSNHDFHVEIADSIMHGA